MSYRSTPTETSGYPKGIAYIISNELAERFSFYGMKAILAIFLTTHLVAMGSQNMSEEKATAYTSFFNSAVYFAPILGAILSDVFWGKYNTILRLSLVYCLGHLCLAFMGTGGVVHIWLMMGLGLIAIGAGGIKPCVSAHVGDQFAKENAHLLSKIQESIDLGHSPNIGWQILAYAIFTCAEIMLSIVCLEFAYTQAPKKMKSFVMGVFLCSAMISEVSPQLKSAEAKVAQYFEEHGSLPVSLDDLPVDLWGEPIRYQILHAKAARVTSLGPDKEVATEWDLGVIIRVHARKEAKEETWLEREKRRLGLVSENDVDSETNSNPYGTLSFHDYAGGQSRLEGAAYFWFFTKLMFATALLFIPFAIAYKPRTYLQEEG